MQRRHDGAKIICGPTAAPLGELKALVQNSFAINSSPYPLGANLATVWPASQDVLALPVCEASGNTLEAQHSGDSGRSSMVERQLPKLYVLPLRSRA